MMSSRSGLPAGRRPLRWLGTLLLVLALAAAGGLGGCGRGQKGKNPAVAGGGARVAEGSPGADSMGIAGPAPASGGATSEMPLPGGGNAFHSQEGRFSVVWPIGCTLIHTRIYPKGATGENIQYIATGCNLYGQRGQGASVTAYLNQDAPGGGPAGPSAVTDKISEMTRNLKLQIVEQHPLAGSYEGVRLFCRELGAKNIVWIQGVLRGDRVYILSAWKPEGGSMTDAAIVRFFQSLRLDAA